jgi:2-oxoglutarate ferredoxin oxidoreductase subunit alpha
MNKKSSPSMNDCVLNVATVNGSGSQSSNNIIMKSFFRMGIPTGGKNLFPSNIAGLPTWFTIRVNKDGYTSRRSDIDVTIAMNADTIVEDIKSVNESGYFIYNADLKFDTSLLRKDTTNIAVPFRQIVDGVTDQIKIKKMLTNMIYVGIITELMGIDYEVLKGTVKDQFGPKKASVIEVNMKAIDAGIAFVKEHVKGTFPFKVQKMNANGGKIIIDGNTAAALGAVFGGCTFVSWYPITPSSSLAENFIDYAEQYRKTPDGKSTFAVVQAEDELAAIGMVIGAGWAGARAMTATSGPGISLMSEFAGYSYFTEIPAVIWDIQRVGPSTGMPTRTMQGDITKCYLLSHGDTKHPVLLPSSPEECFEFGQTCLDLAERLQTLVFVASDLDLGMNNWMSNEFSFPAKPYERGKVLDEAGLTKAGKFERYKDVDGDAIPYRTLPGTQHELAAYFTRGSGHTEKATYTEKSDEYVKLMDRLSRKFETARAIVPKPAIENNDAKIGIIAYGSTDLPMKEARDVLTQKGVKTNYCRLKALPLSQEVRDFVKTSEKVYIVEQNRDAQMKEIFLMDMPEYASKFQSVLHYDGLPIDAQTIVTGISNKEQR